MTGSGKLPPGCLANYRLVTVGADLPLPGTNSFGDIFERGRAWWGTAPDRHPSVSPVGRPNDVPVSRHPAGYRPDRRTAGARRGVSSAPEVPPTTRARVDPCRVTPSVWCAEPVPRPAASGKRTHQARARPYGDLSRARRHLVTTEAFPLTAGQASIFLADQMGAPDGAFTTAVIVEVRGDLRPGSLVDACRRLARHTAALRLRTGIDDATGRFVQWFAHTPPQVDVVGLADDGQSVVDVAMAHARVPFDVDGGQLNRMLVVPMRRRSAVVVLIHHLAVDGVSYRTLARRIGNAVVDTLADEPETAYLDVLHHVHRAEAAARTNDREHWLRRLPAGVVLPSWRASGSPVEDAAVEDGRRLVTLEPAPTARLEARCASAGVGLFPVLAAAVHRALPVAGGDLSAVCAAASVRPRGARDGGVLGCFVNEVPLVSHADTGRVESTLGMAAREASAWHADLARRHHPLGDVAERTVRPDGRLSMALGSVILSYRREPRVLRWRAGGLDFTADLYPRYPTAKAELVIRFFHRPEHLEYEVQWGRHLPRGLGARFTGDLETALTEA